MKRMPGRRFTAIAVTLMSAAGGIIAAAPSASADTLNCLADAYGVQQDNATAIQYDLSGNTAAAATEDADSANNRSQGIPACYYNPDVPYNIYQDVSSGFSYVSLAQSENNAGQAASALASGRAAASYLNPAVTYLENSDAP